MTASSNKGCVLVTGGGGLLGSAIKREVERRQSSNKQDKFQTAGDDASTLALLDHPWLYLSSKDGDLRDPKAAEAIFAKHSPCAVIHLAAKVGGLFANLRQQIEFFDDNIAINTNVLRLSHKYNVTRLISTLSTCVFPPSAPLPLCEDALHLGPPHPSNEGYAMAKRMLECQTRFYREQFGRKWVSVIPTNLYGLQDNFHLEDAHVIPALVHKAHIAKEKGEALTVAGTGTPLRQFLYSDDCAKIFVEILLASPDKLPTLMMCVNPEELSIGDVAKEITKAIGLEKPLQYDTSKSDGIAKKTASDALLKDFLPADFKYTPFAEGIKKTVEWFEENYKTARTG